MAAPLGSAPSIILGVGVGTAAAAAIEPLVVTAAQNAWGNNQYKVFPPGTLAELVAQGYIGSPQAKAEAGFSGFNAQREAALIQLAMKAPGVAPALELLRRTAGPDLSANGGGDDLFTHALRKSALEPQWDAGLTALRWHLLELGQIANAIQQGHITDEGILPGITGAVTPPGGVGTVTSPDGAPAFSVDPTIIDLSGITEAAGLGWDEDRLKVAANLVGLPPGMMELLTLWNRGIIDEDSVNIGLREGHLKTKWTTPVKRLRWSVLSELQYVEARVRGWITNQELYDGGALRGYTQDQLDLLHQTHGRPISARAVSRGLARGGVRLDPVADFTGANPVGANGETVDPIPDTLFKAMQQSNIQQQWYDLERRDIVNYPSLFMLNRLAIADPTYIPRAVTILGYLIYDPIDITAIEKYWNAQTGAAGTIKKQTLAHLMAEYLSGALARDALVTVLTGMGYTADQANDEIALAEFNQAKTARTRAIRSIEKRYVGAQISPLDAQSALESLGLPIGAITPQIAAWDQERADAITGLTDTQIAKALQAGALTAAEATPLLADLGHSPADIATIIATNAPTPA